MNKFRKLVALVLALVCVLALAACAPTAENSTAGSNPPSTTKPTTAPTTQPTTQPTEPEKEVSFRVRVVDQNNEPVANVWVQICLTTCFPKMTDENGYAEWYQDKVPFEDGYHYLALYFNTTEEAEQFEPLPDALDESKWYYFDEGSGEGVITLTRK